MKAVLVIRGLDKRRTGGRQDWIVIPWLNGEAQCRLFVGGQDSWRTPEEAEAAAQAVSGCFSDCEIRLTPAAKEDA